MNELRGPPSPATSASGSLPSFGRWLRWPVRLACYAALIAILFAPALVYADNTYRLTLFSRCAALAIVALGVDLVWGYTGLLSLGQALFLGLGAYMVAYSLKLQQAATSYNAVWGTHMLPGDISPDFMVDYGSVDPNDPTYAAPAALAWIRPLGNIWVALVVAVVLPTLVSFLFGWFTFRRGIKGVYFALITQALVLAAYLVADNQQALTGGRPGVNEIAHLQLGELTFDRSKNAASLVREDYVDLLGFTVNKHRNMRDLYLINTALLLVCMGGCVWLVRSKFGKVLTAIRDNENRVLALGYNTAMYKVFVFTAAGTLAGLGGALFVPVVGKMGPGYIDVLTSIDVVIFVAVGGRGTLLGAVLGTFLVHYGTSLVGEAVKDLRPIIMGTLFVAVVLLMPAGILGMLRNLAAWVKTKVGL